MNDMEIMRQSACVLKAVFTESAKTLLQTQVAHSETKVITRCLRTCIAARTHSTSSRADTATLSSVAAVDPKDGACTTQRSVSVATSPRGDV
jgi:hypothetical protein